MSELEHFKKSIDLRSFAASRGYVRDKRESSENCTVMRAPNGDKIVIIVAQKSGDWVYYSVRDDRDNGTIIDFLQWRGGGSLGEVRKILRAWSGGSVKHEDFGPPLLPVSRDRGAVLTAWGRATPCVSLPYLTSRGLGPEVLALPNFLDRVRVDQRGNALFPHFDGAGLCGFEIKNQRFTGFATGGTKGLWFSLVVGEVKSLVLCESAIDALSFHVLNATEGARYMSTGGALNPLQPALLRSAMEKLPVGASVLLAFDRDAGGEKLVEAVRAVAPSSAELRRVHPPEGMGKDWNDYLKLTRGLRAAERAPEPDGASGPGF